MPVPAPRPRRTAAAVDPAALARLAAGRRVALVSGANGTTTTTAFLAGALRTLGPVATNSTGANLPDGVLGALIDEPDAPFAALEVDEDYVVQVSEVVRPHAVVLSNLTRDHRDLVGTPAGVLVANADDPMVVSAAAGSPEAVWVSAGQPWVPDTAACPRCGHAIVRDDEVWWCRCGLHRPPPAWVLGDAGVTGPDSETVPLPVRLPGTTNRANAAMAIAAASVFGASPAAAARAVGSVRDVAGRYRTVRVAGLP
jgi:lipid II isoglutaminyl synthase (glutamine-hydrolysing)